jgi:hypothetical protein
MSGFLSRVMRSISKIAMPSLVNLPLMLAMGVAAIPAQAAPLCVVPTDITIPAGQTGFVDVVMIGGSNVDAYTLDITFDSSKLEFVSVSIADTLSKGFGLFGGNVVSDGRVRITVVALWASPVSGDGTLLRIELRAKADAEGPATVCTDKLRADLRGAETGCATVVIDENTPALTLEPDAEQIKEDSPPMAGE